jgi:hypothetical protein
LKIYPFLGVKLENIPQIPSDVMKEIEKKLQIRLEQIDSFTDGRDLRDMRSKKDVLEKEIEVLEHNVRLQYEHFVTTVKKQIVVMEDLVRAEMNDESRKNEILYLNLKIKEMYMKLE